MTARRRSLLFVAVVVALLVGAGAFFAGRVVGRHDTAGQRSSYDRAHLDGYFDGLRAGEAQGREEGRAEQVVATLPTELRQRIRVAFQDGYTAGANDAFAGYDGGWTYGTRYVITVEPGHGQIVYRIADREPAR